MQIPVRKAIHSQRYERFRHMLVDARESAGLTQNQLASLINRPQSFVSKYEIGERRLDIEELLQVLEALKSDPVAFIKELVTK